MLGKLIFLIVLAGIGALFLGVKSYNFRGTWHEPFAPAYQADLSGSHLVGKTVVLTGGNTGIGKEMVSALLSMGANVFVGCRSIDRCQKAHDNEIRAQAGELALRRRSSTSVGKFQALSLDLASFKSVRNFVSELNKQAPGSSDVLPIDILVDNAAVANNNTGRTVDGLGEVMGTNHFGVFLLTRLLVPNLAAAGRASGSKSRVVVVSSEAHTHATLYDLDDLSCKGEKHHGILAAFAVYGQSKLSNIFMAREFADRFKQHNLPITANAVHPGFIKTDLARSIPGSWRWVHETISSLLAMNAWDGAQNTLHLAVSPDLAHISGEYYDRFSITAPQLGPYHQLIQKILWDRSSEITGVSKDF